MKDEKIIMEILLKGPMFNDEFVGVKKISKTIYQLKHKYSSLRKFKLDARCNKFQNKKHKRSKNVIYWIEGDELEAIRKLHIRDGSSYMCWKRIVLPILNDNNFIKHLSDKHRGVKIIDYNLTNFLMNVGEEEIVQKLLEKKISNSYSIMCRLQEQ